MHAQEFTKLRIHDTVNRQSDDMAEAAPLQCALERPNKIFGLFVDLDFAVTQDAEDTVVEEPNDPGTVDR